MQRGAVMEALQPNSTSLWLTAWAALSFLALLQAFFLSTFRGTILGPEDHRKINYATFMELFALSVFLLSIGVAALPLTLEAPLKVVHTTLDAIASRNIVPQDTSTPLLYAIYLYGMTLSAICRLATVGLVASIFRRSLAVPRLYLRSLHQDTYVFSHLTKDTLALAQDVIRTYENGAQRAGSSKRVSLCFASVEERGTPLKYEARDCGAIFLDRNVAKILPRRANNTSWTYVLMGDPANDLTDALALKSRLTAQDKESTHIILCSERDDLEPLLNPQGVDNEDMAIRIVNYSQRLAESILDTYPLFITAEKLPADPKSPNEGVGQRTALVPLIEPANPRVLVVGAGSVGTRFIRSSAWCSQIDSLKVDLDVIDVAAGVRSAQVGFDDLVSGAYQQAVCYEGGCTYRFLNIDALSEGYTQYLEQHAEEITYCLICLGDDTLTAQVALRTSQILWREAVQRAAKGTGTFALRCPLIVALVRDKSLATAVSTASRGGRRYDIRCIGERSVFTYESLWGKDRSTEYSRRSSRAADLHRKYRIYAFARSSILGLHGMQPDAQLLDDVKHVDWSSDFSKEISLVKEAMKSGGIKQGDSPLGRLIARYYAFLHDTEPFGGTARADHEWLLRMEHARWNAYMLAEGYEKASLDEVRMFFGTQNLDQVGNGHLHHDDFALLHPCITTFEELDELDDPLEQLYLSDERWKQMGTSFLKGETTHRLKLRDDRYL